MTGRRSLPVPLAQAWPPLKVDTQDWRSRRGSDFSGSSHCITIYLTLLSLPIVVIQLWRNQDILFSSFPRSHWEGKKLERRSAHRRGRTNRCSGGFTSPRDYFWSRLGASSFPWRSTSIIYQWWHLSGAHSLRVHWLIIEQWLTLLLPVAFHENQIKLTVLGTI